MTAKLNAIHWIPTHQSAADGQWFEQTRPLCIKIVASSDEDAPGCDVAYRYLDPNGTLWLRHHLLSENWNCRGFNGSRQYALDQARAHAAFLQRWWSSIHSRHPEIDLSRVLWSGLNEPRVWSEEPPELTAAYYAEFARLLHVQGMRVATFSIGVGWPGNNGTPDNPPNWTPFEPIRDSMRDGDILIVHEYYSVKGPEVGWRWLLGRYVQCPWQVPIGIGEFGIDDFVNAGAASVEEFDIDAYIREITLRRMIANTTAAAIVLGQVPDVTAAGLQHFGFHGLSPDMDVASVKYLDWNAWYDAKLHEDKRVKWCMEFTHDGARDWATFYVNIPPYQSRKLAWMRSLPQHDHGSIGTTPPTPPIADPIRLLMPDGTVRTLALEEYLRAVVPSEVPAAWPAESVKAQAVAARSYARAAIKAPRHTPNADVCTTTHCQAYNATRIHAASDAAIVATAGETITYDGNLAVAFFSANCGGQTVANEVGFGGDPLPYLRSVPCVNPGPKNGHGIGLCQWGAHDMAAAGADYKTILKHYYTGVRLSNEPPPVPDPLRAAVAAYIVTTRAALDTLAAELT